MRDVALGASGLRVSRIGIGTAALGLEDYGIPIPGQRRLDSANVRRTIHAAVDAGVRLFDTAPGYGLSESLLGDALQSHLDCVIATKVAVPENLATISAPALSRVVGGSLDKSLRALRREVLDIVQIHNATEDSLREGGILDCLEHWRDQGKLRWVGVSVYGTEMAMAAIRTGKVQVLQVAVSLLDQRMCREVLPAARQAGVGVLVRSALLKGALTNRAQWLPENLRQVADASARAVRELGTTWDDLPTMAMRFCLSLPGAQSVLVGARGPEEVAMCVAAEAAGPLPAEVLQIARRLSLDDEQLLNPSFWQLEEGDTEQVAV